MFYTEVDKCVDYGLKRKVKLKGSLKLKLGVFKQVPPVVMNTGQSLLLDSMRRGVGGAEVCWCLSQSSSTGFLGEVKL